MSHQHPLLENPTVCFVCQLYIFIGMSDGDGRGKGEQGQRGVCPNLFLPAIFGLLGNYIDYWTTRLRKCVSILRIN